MHYFQNRIKAGDCLTLVLSSYLNPFSPLPHIIQGSLTSAPDHNLNLDLDHQGGHSTIHDLDLDLDPKWRFTKLAKSAQNPTHLNSQKNR